MIVRCVTVASGVALLLMALAGFMGTSIEDPTVAAEPSYDVAQDSQSVVRTLHQLVPQVSIDQTSSPKASVEMSFEADSGARRLQNSDGHYLEFGVPEIITSKTTWAGSRTAPRRSTNEVSYDHGSWEELYFENKASVHQMFRLYKRPEGDVALRIPFRSDRTPRQTGTVISFTGEDGESGFWYSQPYALDSAGLIVPLPVRVAGDALEIHIPADVIAGAKFPLMVDPIVGSTPTATSASGQMWRHPPVAIVYDAVNDIYVMAWHEGIQTSASSNLAVVGNIFIRALRVDTTIVDINDQIEIGTPFGATAAPTQVPAFDDPVTSAGIAGGGVQFSPRLAFNPYAAGTEGRFLIAWSEGSPVYRHGATDANFNLIAEFSTYNDSFPIQSFAVFRRFDVAAADGAVTFRGAATMLDPNQDEDGDGLVDEDPIDVPPFDDDGDGVADEDPPGTLGILTPDMYADVTHDSEGYIYVWQETSGVFPVAIEAIGTQEKRHWWWTKALPLGRRINNDGTFATTAQSLGAQKFRVFVSSGSSAGELDDTLTTVGDLETLYNGKFNYEYVPLDMIPRTTSLIWPGPDGIMYTADDGDGVADDGSLITWSLNSLVFNLPKSRIRARHVPEGADPTGLDTIIFDVFNETGTFAVRPTVTWGLSQQPDDPTTPTINETFTTSIYAVAWQDVQEIAWQGDVRAVELFGNIELRLVEEYGYPSGDQINVGTLSTTDKYLWPSVTFAYESEQIYVGYTRTDGTLFNPVTHMRAYFPKGFTFLDFENVMSPIATLHPVAIAQSHNPTVVDPGNPDTANHHVMASGVEDDFSATYVRRYKFASTPTVGFPKLFVLSSETSATGENPDDDPAPPQLNLNFTTTDSSISPADQTFLIGNVGGTLSKLNWTATAAQSWVEVNGTTIATGGPLGPGTTEAISVSVDPTFLTDGNYTATIDLTSPLATNSPLPVIVNLQIGTGVPPGTPGLTATPTPIVVMGPIGGPNPPPSLFNISFIESAPGEVADWNLSLSSITPAGSAWVFVDPIFGGPLPIDSESTSAGAGQTDGTSVAITLSFELADLVLIGAGPGSYTATLALVSPSTTGADMVTVNTPTITINLTATGPAGELCSNGIDDDGDGDIDCADSECASDPGCAAGGGELCSNGVDDDGDGDIDCADSDCASDPLCGGPGGGGGGIGNTRGGGGASGFLPGCSAGAGATHTGTSSAALALLIAAMLGLLIRRWA